MVTPPPQPLLSKSSAFVYRWHHQKQKGSLIAGLLCSDQRRQKRQGRLEEWKVQALDSIGFMWHPEKSARGKRKQILHHHHTREK